MHQVLWLTLVLVPLWWFLGLKLFIFHFLILVSFAKLIKDLNLEGKHLYIPQEALPLGLFIVTYVLSLVVNFGNNPLLRSFVSFYNLTFWLMGLALILVIYHLDDFDKILKVLSGVRALGVACIIFSLLSLVIWFLGTKHLEITAMLIKFLPGFQFGGSQNMASDNNIWYFTTHLTIVTSDWFLERFFPRVTTFFLYPTALAAGMSAMIPLTWAYYKYSLENKTKQWQPWLHIVLLLVPLVFALSRTVVLALILALLHQVFWDSKKKILVIWFLILGSILFIFNLDVLSHSAFDARPGSSHLRFLIYKLTLEEALQYPFLGIGIKPRTDLLVPIGSHCMYLGILLKTGFVGLLFFLLFQFSIYFQWLKLRAVICDKFVPLWKGLGISFMSLNLWMLTDDLDAPHIVALLYFIIIGCILWLKKVSRG